MINDEIKIVSKQTYYNIFNKLLPRFMKKLNKKEIFLKKQKYLTPKNIQHSQNIDVNIETVATNMQNTSNNTEYHQKKSKKLELPQASSEFSEKNSALNKNKIYMISQPMIGQYTFSNPNTFKGTAASWQMSLVPIIQTSIKPVEVVYYI